MEVLTDRSPNTLLSNVGFIEPKNKRIPSKRDIVKKFTLPKDTVPIFELNLTNFDDVPKVIHEKFNGVV